MIDARFIPTTGGQMLFREEILPTGQCLIQRAYTNTGFIAEGSGSSDYYTFYVPLQAGTLVSSGNTMTEDAISVNEPGAEFCVNVSDKGSWQLFAVPKHTIEKRYGLERRTRRWRYSVRNQRLLADRFRVYVAQAISAISQRPTMETSPAIRMMEADLVSLLAPLLQVEIGRKGRPAEEIECSYRTKATVLKKSIEYIRELKNYPIHASDLAIASGVSERTLRRVFQEFYGVGPRTFILARQLEKVHQDLRQSNPAEATVTDVLTRWGVWEFGRFSGRYKQYYGVLPSQTLHSICL